MVRKCCVPLCTATYDKNFYEKKENGGKCPPTFTCPDETLLSEWQRKIPRANYTVTMKSPVCGRHFDPDDIEWFYTIKLPDGKIEKIERGKPSLKKTAVPKIFDGPKYLSTNKTKRKAPAQRSTNCKGGKLQVEEAGLQPINELEENETHEQPAELPATPPPQPETEPHPEPVQPPFATVNNIHSDPYSFTLPSRFWGVHTDREKVTAFSYLNPSKSMDAERIVVFTDSLRIVLRKIDMADEVEVANSEELSKLLARVHNYRLCIGHTDEGCKDRKFSPKCLVKIPDSSTIKAVRCKSCRDYRHHLKRQKVGKSRAEKLAKKLKISKQKGSRMEKRVP